MDYVDKFPDYETIVVEYFYYCSIQAVVDRWWKCIANGGDYVKNWPL